MDNILNEMGEKWTTLSRDQKVALAQTVAGVRQYNQLMNLMDNWDFFQENLTTAYGSEGALQEQADIYAESWEAARERVRAAAEDIYDSLINPDFFIELDNALTPTLTIIADLIDGMGGLSGAASIAAFALTKLYGDKIQKGLRNVAENVQIIFDKKVSPSQNLRETAVDEASDLSITYGADKHIQTQINIMREEVKLQGTINDNAAELSEYQLDYIKGKQQVINLYKQEALEASKLVATLETEKEDTKNSIAMDLELEDGWKDKLDQALKLIPEDYTRLNLNFDVDNDDADKVMEKVTKSMERVISKSAGLRTIKQNFGDINSATDETIEQMREAAKTLDLFKDVDLGIKDGVARTLDDLSIDEFRDKLKELNLASQSSGKDLKNLQKILTSLGADSSEVKRYVSTLKDLQAQRDRGILSQEEYEAKVRELDDEIANKLIPDLNDWASALVTVSNSMIQVFSSIQAIKNLGNIWADEDMSAGEKIIQTMTALSMLYPAVISMREMLNMVEQQGGIIASFTAAKEALFATSTAAAGAAANTAAPAVSRLSLATTGLGKAITKLLGPIGLIITIGSIAVTVFDLITSALEESKVTTEEATEAYEESVNKISELNSELETTKSRIEELQKQPTLTFAEEQELTRLQRQNKLLERQIKLEKEQAKLKQKEQAKTIDKNFVEDLQEVTENKPKYEAKSFSLKLYQTPSDYASHLVAEGKYDTIQEAMDEDPKIIEWLEEQEESLEEFQTKYGQTLQTAEQQYSDYLAAIDSGAIDYDEEAVLSKIEALKEARLALLGDDQEKYVETYITPILDSEEFDEVKGQIYDALKGENGPEGAMQYISDDFEELARTYGVTVEEVLKELDTRVDKVQNKVLTLKVNSLDGQSAEEELEKFNNLSDEDKDIFYSLNLENVDNWDKAWELFEAAKQKKLSVDLKLSVNEVNDSLDLLNSGKELDSDAIADLEALKSKYSELADIQNVNSHEYLIALQKIREQQEENALEALRQTREKQQAEAEELQEQINNLPKDSLIYEVRLKTLTDEFDAKMKEIQDTDYSIKMQVDADLATDVEDAFGMAREFEKLQSYISDGLEITFDEAQSLIAAGYGEILRLSTETANGTILLNETVTKDFITNKQQEIEADKESKIAQFENQKQVLLTKETLLTQEIEALETALNTKDEQEAASALAKAQYLQAGVDAASEAANKEMEYAEDANVEISEDAKRLSEFLGGVQTTNAENAQTSSDDADTAYAAMAENAINYANQMQLAYVAVSNAVKASATGSATYSPVSFKGKTGGIKVGVTRAKLVEDDYEVTTVKLDPEELTQKILEEANYNVEAIKAVAREQLKNAEAELTATRNQIGAIDSGIAALRGGSKSLNNTLANLGKGSGKGSSGSGSDKESKAAKDESEAAERYHAINRQLEIQEELLSKINEEAERVFGLDRLKLYEKELDEINKKAAYEQLKMSQAGTYLNEDIQAIKDLGLKVEVDADTKEITNWQALMNQTIAEYKAAIAKATEDEADTIKELYDNRIAAIEQYEETAETYREQQQKVWEALREARDAELRNTTYKLDVLLNVKNMKDAARDFSKEITESFSDELYHGISAAQLGAEGAQAEMDLLPEYLQQYEDLKHLLDTADEFTSTEDIISSMEELQSNIISSGEALLEWIETVETMLPDALDAARERFDLFTNQLDHNTTVLDTAKELLSLQGVTYKTNREFNTLQKISQEKLDAAVASAELQKQWYESARVELLEAQRALEQVNEGDAAYDTLKNNRDALLEEYNTAQEAMLQSAQEAMETAREMFLSEIEKASYEFSQAISDGIGLEFLQERYDHLIEEEERYLDEVNTTYEQLKWNSKLQTAIDEASSQATKNQLTILKEEFEQRKKNNEISQYDIDILNAKYEMIQKQIALEEAQNNKSQVRLVRNSQGNWDYQYTSDQSAIDDANQEYADAANNYYNIAKNQVKDITQEIVNTWEECNEKVREVYEDETLTVAEREEQIAEIRQFYSDKILFLEEQKNNALKDMTEAGGDIISQYGNTYDEVLDLMQDGTADFNEAFNDYLDDMEDAWNDYNDTVGEVADSTGTNMDDLKDIIDDVSDSTDDCRETGEELTEEMWEQIDAIHELSEEYANWAAKVYEVVAALEDLAIAQGKTAEDASKESEVGKSNGFSQTADYAYLIKEGLSSGLFDTESDTFKELNAQRDNKIDAGYGGGTKKTAEDFKQYEGNSGSMTWAEFEAYLKKYNIQGFSTGGYTGEFPDSKLAFLHEKELVLNQEDTQNMLTAVQMMRDLGPSLFKQIEAVLDSNAVAGANLLDAKMSRAVSANSTTQDVVQHISVTAEFPNATDQNEIKEAILGLANYATQIVNPR